MLIRQLREDFWSSGKAIPFRYHSLARADQGATIHGGILASVRPSCRRGNDGVYGLADILGGQGAGSWPEEMAFAKPYKGPLNEVGRIVGPDRISVQVMLPEPFPDDPLPAPYLRGGGTRTGCLGTSQDRRSYGPADEPWTDAVTRCHLTATFSTQPADDILGKLASLTSVQARAVDANSLEIGADELRPPGYGSRHTGLL